jgi:hypothetical protein
MSDYSALSAKNLNAVIPVLVDVVYVDADGVEEHLYLTDNNENINYDGNVYQSCKMSVSLPSQEKNSDGKAKITLSAVDQSIMKIIDQADETPTFNIIALLIQNPYGSPIISKLDGYTFAMDNISGSADKLQCSLISALLVDFNCPRWVGNNINLPGLA